MTKLKIFILTVGILMVAATPASAAIAPHPETTVANPDSVVEKKAVEPALCRNLFVELFGPSTFGVFGLGYDSRFRAGSVFGYRVGVSYINVHDSDPGGFFYQIYSKGVSFPLEVNAIMGKRKSKFEVGIGMIPSIVYRQEDRWGNPYHKDEFGYPAFDWSTHIEKEGTCINIMGLMNIGYRYQRRHGFFFRTGITYLIGDYKCSPVDGAYLIPYFGFGYTF